MAATLGDIRDLIQHRLREIEKQKQDLDQEKIHLQKALTPLIGTAKGLSRRGQRRQHRDWQLVEVVRLVSEQPTISIGAIEELLGLPYYRAAYLAGIAKEGGFLDRDKRKWTVIEPEATNFCAEVLKPLMLQIIEANTGLRSDQLLNALPLNPLPSHFDAALTALQDEGTVANEKDQLVLAAYKSEASDET